MHSRNIIVRGTRLVLFVVLTLSLVLSLGSCAKKEPQIEKISVAEGLAPAAAPLFVADAKGLWQEEALEVSAQTFLSGKLCLDAVLGGKVEVATVAETPLVHAGMQAQKFYVICTFMASERSLKVIARKDSDIAKPEDLKGKKVATLFGTSAEFFMDTFLTANGLSRDDVKATNLKPPDMVSAIVRGDVDACFIWEPHVHNMKKVLGDNGVVFWRKGLYTETFNLVALQDYVDKHPEVIERVLKTMLRAEQFIQANRDEAIKIVSEKVGLDVETLESIWEDYNFTIALDPILVAYMQKEGEWAKTMGSAPATAEVPDYRAFIYTDGLKKLKPERMTLK